MNAGVKSTAILFGSYVRPILGLFSAVFVGSLIYAGLETGQGLPYFAISVGGTAAHLLWQLGTLDVDSPADCWNKFDVSNNLLIDHHSANMSSSQTVNLVIS